MHKKRLEGVLINGIKTIFKTETQGAGKINLVFGILVFLFCKMICIDNIFITVMNYVYNKPGEAMPWYGKIIVFSLMIAFFTVCILWLIYVNKSKGDITNKKSLPLKKG